jgi:ketosteroid isomerase-like protein
VYNRGDMEALLTVTHPDFEFQTSGDKIRWVSLFRNQAMAEEADELAREFVREELADST